VNNYYEKVVASTENILTAAAFRPGLLLGSGFGKFKAGALFFHADHEGLNPQRSAVAVTVRAQLLESGLCAVRTGSRINAQSITVGKSSPVPLAFRPALLASWDVRPNLFGSVLLSVVLGLPLDALAAAPGCMKMLRIFSPIPCPMSSASAFCGRCVAVPVVAPKSEAVRLFHSMFSQLPSTPDVLPNIGNVVSYV
jgi:hypothetical protein